MLELAATGFRHEPVTDEQARLGEHTNMLQRIGGTCPEAQRVLDGEHGPEELRSIISLDARPCAPCPCIGTSPRQTRQSLVTMPWN